MLSQRASLRPVVVWLRKFMQPIFLFLLLASLVMVPNTNFVSAKPAVANPALLTEVVVVPRNYLFEWGSSGQNIKANNDVYCSSNPDFWQVLYWRTSDTVANAGITDWNPNVPISGDYDIYVFLPDYTHGAPITTQAKYYLNGQLLATLDQNQNKCQWVHLGRRYFDAGYGATISMPAKTSENPYRLIAGDGLKLVYAPPPTFTLSGLVRDSGSNGISGVTLSLSTGATTTSDGNGYYQFTGLLAGNYTVTASRSGDSFTPGSQTVNVSGNTVNVNFTINNRYFVTGRLADTNGNPIPNVTVTLNGLSVQLTTTSAADGRYTFSNLIAGLYQVKPDNSTYSFSPGSRGWMFVPPNATGQDFSSAPVYGSVSGKVTATGSGSAVADARVSIGGKVAQTDGSGNYSINGILPGDHIVYITATGYENYQSKAGVQAGSTTVHNASIKFIPPVGYRLPFPGGQPRLLYNTGHSSGYAQDWTMPVGSDVAAARDGKVLYVKENSNTGGKKVSCSYGNYIAIKHDDGNLTWYVHLQYQGALVNVGDPVKSGQVIAKSGNTGCTSGPHLHFAWTTMQEKRMVPNFLDVTGGVPQVGKTYTSGNYLAGNLISNEPNQMLADTVPPVGSLHFNLAGSGTDKVSVTAFDYESNTIQMRLANSEAALQSAPWQPLASSIDWTSPVIYGQFKDEAGNVSSVYSEIIEPTAYEKMQPAFSAAPQICSGSPVSIENQTVPLCEQCGWSWNMGNGTNFYTLNPVWMGPGDGFEFNAPGTYTVTLQSSNAEETQSKSQDIVVLESPTGDFTMTRTKNTITVTANDDGAVHYAWNFGDGTTAIGRSASHTYANAETLEVSAIELTVTAQNGCSTTTQQSANLLKPIYVPVVTR